MIFRNRYDSFHKNLPGTHTNTCCSLLHEPGNLLTPGTDNSPPQPRLEAGQT